MELRASFHVKTKSSVYHATNQNMPRDVLSVQKLFDVVVSRTKATLGIRNALPVPVVVNNWQALNSHLRMNNHTVQIVTENFLQKNAPNAPNPSLVSSDQI